MKPLFKEGLTVVNAGLAGFADNVVAAGGSAIAVDWQPPAQGDRDAGGVLVAADRDALIAAGMRAPGASGTPQSSAATRSTSSNIATQAGTSCALRWRTGGNLRRSVRSTIVA